MNVIFTTTTREITLIIPSMREITLSVPSTQGPAGPQGPQGLQGIQGETGPQGIQGDPGPKGDKGDTGDQGIQGIQGVKGDTGDTGPQGIQGIQGIPGADGVGVPVGGTAGQALVKIDGTNYNTQWSGLTGDVTGALNATVVARLQGRNIAATAPTSGQNLTWDGTAWTPTTPTASGTLAGDVTGALGSNTVVRLQNRSVAATAPTTGQALVWDGTSWSPAAVSGAPGGATGQVQFNNAGVFGGSSNFVWENVNGRLTIGSAALDGAVNIAVGGTKNALITVNGTRFLHMINNVPGSTVLDNLFLGLNAGSLTNTGALRNTGVGRFVGNALTTGSLNMFFGDAAGYQLTTGEANVMIGRTAGGNATTASSNVFIGTDCGLGAASASGSNNVGIGRNTLKAFSTCVSVVAIGSDALAKLTSGIRNTAVGAQAGNETTTGQNNTYIGRAAGFNVTTGSGNTFIGSLAGFGITTNNPTNVTAIYNDQVGTKASGVIGNNICILGWDQRISIGASLAPAGMINVVSLGATSATWTAQFHNSSGNNNAFMVRDDGAVAMGTATPDASALLDVSSTTQGFLPPRITTAQRDLIATPAAGLVIYNTSTNKHQGWNGTTWNDFY